MFGALIQQESNGDPSAIGPQTRYGHALGSTQLLPSTAKAMADKLGLPWRPELLMDNSEIASRYQKALGRAYFDEGLSKTGNVHDALEYYHGGPNRSMWGPKTRAYADNVLARLN